MSLYVDIEKNCGDFCLKVKLEAEKEVLGLLGASGCGKSMTLKCIAGIEKPDRGIIRLVTKCFLMQNGISICRYRREGWGICFRITPSSRT